MHRRCFHFDDDLIWTRMLGRRLEDAQNLARLAIMVVYGASRHGPGGLMSLDNAALGHARDSIGLTLLEVSPIRNHEFSTL